MYLYARKKYQTFHTTSVQFITLALDIGENVKICKEKIHKK